MNRFFIYFFSTFHVNNNIAKHRRAEKGEKNRIYYIHMKMYEKYKIQNTETYASLRFNTIFTLILFGKPKGEVNPIAV